MLLAPLLSALLLALAPLPAAGASERPYEVTEERAACADHDPLKRPFFGDTHVHTAYSFDARGQDTRNGPRDAYRFAKGEAMGIQPYDDEGSATRTIRIDRPLDWAVVTDHSEFFGEMRICNTPGTWSYWHPACIVHRNRPGLNLLAFGYYGLIAKRRWGICGEDGAACASAARGVWEDLQAAAEEAYDRSATCSFTSFLGYEWTGSVGEGVNLHRNVIFRNERVPAAPVSWIDTPSAVDLWDRLQEECVEGIDGCDVLTIPHNSNLSAGYIFQTARITEDAVPGPIDRQEAERRSRWEPLVEIMQHKGDSECDRQAGTVWAGDEACGFEKLPYDRFGAMSGAVDVQQAPPSSFVRDALKRGLRFENELGANPFKYGIVASTDTHVAAPGRTEEKDHPGHGGAGKGGGAEEADELPDDFEFNPGGLAVLWAEENSRDALFAAMRRREAYGTSGTRPIVRFFGGWGYADDLCSDPRLVEKGYAGGVPMGGDLPPAPGAAAAPRFVVWAAQDPGAPGGPETTPLQRIQIVKGWVEGRELHERVLDVAGGPNGASVDLATCEPRGEGAASLCTVWTDPDFDPRERAFYYARVLENPTCRWSQWFCLEAGVDCEDPDSVPEGLRACCSDAHRASIQERAWTSPIWYDPPGRTG